MRRISLLVLFSVFFLTNCSTYERKAEEESPPFPPSNADDALAGADQDPASAAPIEGTSASQPSENMPTNGDMEGEVARLNAKIAALETKVAVLTETLERERARSSQPALRAEPANLADSNAHGDISQDQDPAKLAHETGVAAEPAQEDNFSGSKVEEEFRGAMKLFNQSSYREAANRFFAVSKTYSNHLLAAHALYWAGEAGARAKNWKVAIAHWSSLEQKYPRCFYLPEVLAGLATAHDAIANASEAKHYRELLLKAFPDAPAAAQLTASIRNVEQGSEP